MRCPSCFAEEWNQNLCAECGYSSNVRQEGIRLPIGHSLHNGEYIIGKVLGKPGGFGITYLALNSQLDIKVAIKEFMPFQFVLRDAGGISVSLHSRDYESNYVSGLNKFLEEAKTLAQLKNPNIVRVSNYFSENGTGYIVMDYIEGESLQEYMERIGRIRTEDAIQLMLPILRALDYLHSKGIIHRDVKPTNIYITTDGQPVLLDFGSARQTMLKDTLSMTAIVSPGYAPIEQYNRKGKQGPFTDIYSCAAVLYQMISGIQPQESLLRNVDDEIVPLLVSDPQVSPSVNDAIMWGLNINPHERPKNIQDFAKQLCQTNSTAIAPEKVDNSTSRLKSFSEEPQTDLEGVDTEAKRDNRILKKKKLVTLLAIVGIIVGSYLYHWDLNREKSIEHSIRVGKNEYVGIYTGKVRGGQPNGTGMFKYSYTDNDALVFTRGKIEDGIKKVEVSYSGNFKNGLYEGKGLEIQTTELRYKVANNESSGEIAKNTITRIDGEWLEGSLNGNAVIETSGKIDQCRIGQCKLVNFDEKYVGETRKGVKNGRGVLTRSQGSDTKKIVGIWANGLFENGNAEINELLGRYVGEYRLHQPHGKGVYLYSDGEKYDGMWKKGQYSGHGEYIYSDGSRYTGYWQDGKYNGSGEYMFAGGVKVVGVFRDGIPEDDEGRNRIILPNGHMVWGRCSGTGGTGFECSWYE